uniref:Uncharacterized protein n=1 Tax=Arundo donax TaxID=35708 RepID=A0A0A9CG95_ARUDO
MPPLSKMPGSSMSISEGASCSSRFRFLLSTSLPLDPISEFFVSTSIFYL